MYHHIKSDIKEAMKVKDNVKRDCLKNVLGKAQNDAKFNSNISNYDEITDEIVIAAIQKEVKQLTQTVNSLSDRQDTELYKVSKLQIEILNEYLPKQMDKKEVEEAVAWILSKGEYKNFGDKMRIVMKEMRGKADNNMIRKAVEAYK